jgi:hypothetical protein
MKDINNLLMWIRNATVPEKKTNRNRKDKNKVEDDILL